MRGRCEEAKHAGLLDGLAAPFAASKDKARLRATIARLRKTIDCKNKELAQLHADVPALVRAVLGGL